MERARKRKRNRETERERERHQIIQTFDCFKVQFKSCSLFRLVRDKLDKDAGPRRHDVARCVVPAVVSKERIHSEVAVSYLPDINSKV